jgi:hypothetical protein
MPSPIDIHQAQSEYWSVEMGERDHLNGPATYQFPTPEAAAKFAATHKQRDPHRDVAVRSPEGSRFVLATPER